VILRPHLRLATHEIEYPPSHLSSQRNNQWSQHNSPMATSEASTPTSRSAQMTDLSEGQNQVVQLACQCIESAVQSIIAFDRVGAADDVYQEFKSTRKTLLILPNILEHYTPNSETSLSLQRYTGPNCTPTSRQHVTYPRESPRTFRSYADCPRRSQFFAMSALNS
jgi:hypothetical protein